MQHISSIRNLRQGLRLTQKEFAIVIGAHAITVSRWENGHNDPSPLARGHIKALRESYNRKK